MISYYLFFINVLAFILYALDKWKAKRGLWRIPERVLLLAAAAGGSVGAYFAMRLFHHKTRHLKFKYGVPLLFILQAAAAFWLASKNGMP